jgi:type I restriction enzyme S subunit
MITCGGWDMNSVESAPLEEWMESIIDYRGKTPEKTSAGVPLITAKIVKNGTVGEPDEFIAYEAYEEWMRRGIPEEGDVVITTEAPLGEVAQIPVGRFALAQRIITLRGKRERVSNTYLKYLFLSSGFQSVLHSRATGTTVLGIKQSALREIPISIPPLPEQRAIAHILGTLDDKIELNRRMNATLEAMAQALFKSWFMDFDGHDDLVASEIGLVPQGWEVRQIGDVVRVLGGSTPSTQERTYWDGGIHAWATPKDLSGLTVPILLGTERRITDSGLQRISSGLLPSGTFLLSSRAPIGYTAIAQMPVAINQGFIAVPPGGTLPPAYLLFWSRLNMDSIKGRASGTTFAEISKAAFRPIPVAIPPAKRLEEYDEKVGTLLLKMAANANESSTLTTLRDTLLPKLISGELRVPDAEAALEAAGV